MKTQAAANYRPASSSSRRCGVCRFSNHDGTCQLVEPPIAAGDVCDLFQPMKGAPMAELSTADRKALPRSDFIFPDKAPGPGSYPAPDVSHARDALARVEENGTPAERTHAIAWVKRRYPDMDVEAKP